MLQNMLSENSYRSVLQRMLRRNPLAALSLHRPSSASSHIPEERRRENPLLHDEDPVADAEEEQIAHLIANRQGEVLGPHAILKEDHFPGACFAAMTSSQHFKLEVILRDKYNAKYTVQYTLL